jgi:hypothetical protein
LARGVAFYSGDAPAEFIDLDVRLAPWVTPAELSRKGLLAICKEEDAGCIAAAMTFAHGDASTSAVTVAHSFLGYHALPMKFVLIVVPPREGGTSEPSGVPRGD